MDPSIPAVVESDPEVTLDDDVAAFLKGYEENLADELAEASFPEEITDSYSVIDCLKKEDDGKKETYFLKRRSDGLPAILRITRDYTAEDALEEAKMLTNLHVLEPPWENNKKIYPLRGVTLIFVFAVACLLATIICNVREYLDAESKRDTAVAREWNTFVGFFRKRKV